MAVGQALAAELVFIVAEWDRHLAAELSGAERVRHLLLS